MGKPTDWVIIMGILLVVCLVCLTSKPLCFEPKATKDFNFSSKNDTQESPNRLTIAQLRKHKGFESINGKDAKEIIDGLYALSTLTFKIYKNGTGKL